MPYFIYRRFLLVIKLIHYIAIAADKAGAEGNGGIFTWGANQGRQLGHDKNDGTNNSRLYSATPTEVDFGADDPRSKGDRWYQVAGGLVHSMALTENGDLFIWGMLTKALTEGNGTYPDPISLVKYPTPTKIPREDNGSPWRVIAAGHSSAFAINEAGNLYAWGTGSFGLLGFPSDAQGRDVPTLVDNISEAPDGSTIPWIRIAVGERSVYGLKKDGSLWVWGQNNRQQLGLPSGDLYETPQSVEITELDGSSWRQIVAGNDHVAALDMRGNLWTWGNTNGFRGGDNKGNKPGLAWTFEDTDPYGVAFTLINAHGGEFAQAITSNGRMYLFGNNGWGQLGTSEGVPANPGPGAGPGGINWLETPVPGEIWVSISTGGSTSLGILSDGTLWGWGQNLYGQLAKAPDLRYSITPVKIER